MKKLSKYFILSLFATLLFTASCVKDNGNYKYNELPEMDFTEVAVTANGKPVNVLDENTIYVNKDDNVVIEPQYKFDASINATYVWSLFVDKQPVFPTPPIPADTLSTDAKLVYQFKQIPGRYKMVLEVTNNIDGKSFKKITNFILVVEAINGVVVVYNREGDKGDFAVFKTSEIDKNIPKDGVVQRLDIFSSINNGTYLKNPKFINLDYDLKSVYNFGTADGVVMTDIEFNMLSTAHESLFSANTAPAAPFAPQFMVSRDAGGGTKFGFLINENKLYARTAPSFGAGDNLFGKFNDNDYFPYVVMARMTDENRSVAHIVFNKTTKAFEYLRAGYGFIMWGMDMTRPPLPIVPGGPVSIDKTNMDIIAYGRSGSTLVAIMKDATSKINLVRFNYPKLNSEDKPEATCLTTADISALPSVASSNVWEFGVRGDYVFYSKDNKLYVINALKNSVIEPDLGIPSDEVITKISMFEDPKNTEYNGAVIFVSTLKSGKVGTIYQFVINTLSGRPDTASKKVITGLGEVVDIKYIKQL